jgi:glycosyltransferase involved in cell wall biosynthesis
LRVALVDGASSVLPYDYQLARVLAAQGVGIDFHGSRTRYNGELLAAMAALPGALVKARDISGTVAPRFRGLMQYASLLWTLCRERRRYVAVNLQFSVLWALELPFLFVLRDRLVFTVHNAVPHGHAGQRHAPTGWIAGLARTLVFPSRFTHDDFLRRYGERFRPRSVIAGHGLSPVLPESPLVPYRALARPEAIVYWSTIKPYKGVELFAELARSPRIAGTGLPLEVHGAWAAELQGLRDELVGLGVRVDSGFLDSAQMLSLLARPVVFLLPNREATQSGALYTLLHHGCFFICADVGDLGDFMRRFGLERLLLKERNADAVADCLEALRGHGDELVAAFQKAQDASAWEVTTAGLAAVYAGVAAAATASPDATIGATEK